MRKKTLVDAYRFALKHGLDYSHTTDYISIKLGKENIFLKPDGTLRHKALNMEEKSDLNTILDKMSKAIPLIKKLENL